VSFSDFLGHHAEASNPFLSPEVSRSVSYSHNGRPFTEEKLEELWILGLQRLFQRFLLPFGGVRTGLTREGRLTIELNAVGRYVLGLANDLALDTTLPAKTPVRVQPDFEIVFVAGSPALEAAISRFGERRGTGVGVLFRITRDSIFQAAQSGLGAGEVLATLAGASTTPVPANVEHEIRAWFASCRRLRIEPVHLVRCPDAATAVRVLAAAGAGKLEALSETVLALTDPVHKAAVTRACRKAGLFLASGSQEPTSTRGARGRR
jgi:Helicase conserved C-terminal domain